MAIAGVVTRSGDATMALAAPSPTYAFVLAEEIQRGSASLGTLMMPAVLCAAGYALFGVGLLAMAAGRAHARLGQERERLTQLESMLDAELQAEEAAAAPGAELAAPAPQDLPTS
jgi:hypothetical protein